MISSTVMPQAQRVATQSMRSAAARQCGRIASSRAAPFGARAPARRALPKPLPDLEPRSAFCIASLKVRPIAITSPTDFICVPSVGVGGRGTSRRPSAGS
jgi:hypothetical protein